MLDSSTVHSGLDELVDPEESGRHADDYSTDGPEPVGRGGRGRRGGRGGRGRGNRRRRMEEDDYEDEGRGKRARRGTPLFCSFALLSHCHY